MSDPYCTVVIRSFNRLPELRALLGIVLGQREVDFEVLVVDSTPEMDDATFRARLACDDPRVRVLRTPPRGCAAAANEGMRGARGEVVAFVDDDDVPVGDRWLAALLAPLADARCLGVNGRMDYTGEGPPRVPRVRAAWLRDRWMLSYGPFKKPRVFPGSPRPKRGIGWLTGGNAALRRRIWERFGPWDESIRYHNEHSLFLRLGKHLGEGEYLAYEPAARMVIRRDVAGGLDHRTQVDVRDRVDTLARYYFWLVAPEHPLRIWGALPLFAPYFLVDAGIHAAELAEHTRANLLRQFVAGVAYAPRAALRAILQRPAPRP